MPPVVSAAQGQHNMDGSADENIALAWYKAGMSVVPIQANGTKRPTRDWSVLQRARLTRDEVLWYWRPGEPVGVALICGAISRNLEMTELEAAATDSDCLSKIRHECKLRGIIELWDELTLQGYAEWTPSGGLHLLYRVPEHEIPGNTKLAATATGKTLAETRGEGGYVIVAPSNGHCHPSGEAWTTLAGKQGVVPEITWSQRMALHSAITAALDDSPPPPPPTPRREIAIRTEADLRPGDDFNVKASWEDSWFTNEGWKISHRSGTETFWVRPGKDTRDGHSASTGYNGDADRLFVWSTSAGLPTEIPLTKFWVYAHYHHGGDLSRAAKALRQQGFGAPDWGIKPLKTWNEDAPTSNEVALPPQGGLDLTDMGSGIRMKELYGDRFRFNTREKAWYEWDGTRWQLDEHQAIHRAAEAVAEQTYQLALQLQTEAVAGGDQAEIKRAAAAVRTAQAGKMDGRLTAAVRRFSTQDGISVTSDVFDRDPNMLNLPNGLLDLESGQLLPHDPNEMATKVFGATLDKDATCPRFRDFMEAAVPDVSVREYVQRALGYTLMGNPQERVMFMLHGPSGTGKSVLTNLMTRIFGGYGETAPASTFRLKKQNDTLDLHKLRGARYVATSEMPEGQQLDEDLVKRVTGGDAVTSRGHYEAYTEWRPNCVIWIATNFLPRVTSDDNAIWRRAKTIYMGTEFGTDGRPEVLGYASVLYEEADGILNWLLEGLEAYKLRGLDEPSAVTRDVEAYREDSDSVSSFIRDRTEDGGIIQEPDAEVKSAIVAAMFEQYCQENRFQLYGRRRFANRMKNLGFHPSKVGGVAIWKGLRQNVDFGVRGLMR